VALYRGVIPVAYENANAHDRTEPVFREVCALLTERDYVRPGELVIFTKGTAKGVTGSTNEMRILSVTGE
jgi:pyruvate kinase